MKLKNGYIGLLLWLLSHGIFADQCTQVFPNGGNSTLSGGGISMGCGSQILNAPSNALPTSNFNGCGNATCGNVACTASGSPVSTLNLGSFQISSGAGGSKKSKNFSIDGNNDTTTDWGDITVNSNGTLNFTASNTGTTLYRMTSLTMKNNTVVNFVPGDYWIGSLDLSGGQTVTINVVGTGTVRLHINQDLNISSTVNWNTGSSASQLLIYDYGNINVNATANINAIMYAGQSVNVNSTFNLTGAISGDNLNLGSKTTITYDSDAVANTDFSPSCPGGSSSVRKFGVSAPATGTNCQAMTVTVTAENNGGQTVQNYTGNITITTQDSTGTWTLASGHGTFSGGTNGVATYTYAGADNGVVSFYLNYPSSGASPITIEAYQTSDNTINGYSNAINFVPSSLLVTGTVVKNPPNSPPPAFVTTEVAATNFTLYLTAYSGSSCGIVSSYSGAKTLRFYTTYVNPTSGTKSPTINGTAIATSSGATQTTQSITFTNGAATVTMNYPDCGQLNLNVIDTSAGGPSGASGNFVVIPASFAFNIPGNSATQTTTPQSAAVSACLADSVFKTAGGAFTVNIQPLNSAGVVTPNYGNETTPQGITLTSSALLAPAGGRNGSTNAGVIGNGSTFTKFTSGGPFSSPPYFSGTTFYFDEVGCINLTASVTGGNYLGATGGAVSSSIVVGRFTPHHFSASGNTPQFSTQCSSAGGSFTYLDQFFSYATAPVLTVTAQALLNTTTQNYTGSFWKLANTALGNVYNKAYFPVNGGDTIPALVLNSPNPVPVFVDGGAGAGTFTFSAGTGGMSIQRLAGTNSPALTASIQLNVATITDSDGVTCTGTGCVSGGYPFGALTSGNGIAFSGTGGGNQFYHGRMVIVDSIGSELLALTVPMQTQFYTTAGGFVINTLDSCSTISGGASNLTLTPSSGLTTTPTLPNPATFSLGIMNINLSAPNVTGNVAIDALLETANGNLPWLQFNWPYNGATSNFTVDPRGLATFGIYKGNNRIIYQKEVYN